MRLCSVNVGLPREASWRGKSVTTGIFKEPVRGRVVLRAHNLEGDGQADLSVHGGADKAVYAYPREHYSHWCEVLGVARLPFGALGENLTTEGLLESELCIGDRLRIGTALLEVSQPRAPCFKLGLRHRRPDLPKLFLRSGRSGFYFRVIREGELEAGDAIAFSERDARGLSVAEVQGLTRGEGEPELLRRAVEHPALAEAFKQVLRERLPRTPDGGV